MGSRCLDGASVTGGGSGVGTWGRGRGRGLATTGIAVPCAERGAPCAGCSALDEPCCPCLNPACRVGLAAYVAVLEASGGQVEVGDQRASGDQEAFDALQASGVHPAYHVALEDYRSLVASVPGASLDPSAAGLGPLRASHPWAFSQDHLDPSPSA